MTQNNDSRQLLEVLDEDRARLGDRVSLPAWLAPTIGLITAAWIASPAIGDQNKPLAYPIALGAVILAISLAARSAGVRHGRLRGQGYGILGLATALGLALYSTSLGLVASDLRWWVIAPALVMAAVGYAATRLLERESQMAVTRGR